MFDWDRLTDSKSLAKLKENGFLLEGGDYTALSQTLKALAAMQRKFDPDVMNTIPMNARDAQTAINGTLQALRAPAYKGAIVAQGLLHTIRGLSLQNPMSLSLFNNTELQMINRVARGEQLNKKAAEQLTEKLHKLASVLFIAPATTVGGRSAAAQRPQESEQQLNRSQLDTLLEAATPPEDTSLFMSP